MSIDSLATGNSGPIGINISILDDVFTATDNTQDIPEPTYMDTTSTYQAIQATAPNILEGTLTSIDTYDSQYMTTSSNEAMQRINEHEAEIVKLTAALEIERKYNTQMRTEFAELKNQLKLLIEV